MHRSGTTMAWNVFKFCTALRGLGSIMILLVLGIVGVTYYAVVWTNYGPALSVGGLDSLAALVVILLFHFLVNPFHRFLESFVLLLKKLIIMMCVCVLWSWGCFCGVTSLLCLLILVLCQLRTKRSRRESVIRWIVWSLAGCSLMLRTSELGSVGNVISISLLAAIIALFVSSLSVTLSVLCSFTSTQEGDCVFKLRW